MQHELGHNFGLEHSSYIDYPSNSTISSSACPNPSDPSKCEYGDPGDVMGSGPDLLHAFNRYKLGWLPESDIATVDGATPDQTITLSSLDQSTGIRDIAIPISNASGYSYHVEYRQSDRTLPGVTIRLDKPNQDNMTFHSFLIPGRTDHTNPTQAALTEAGQTFIDSVNRVSITFVSKNSATATIHITVPSGPIPNIDAVNYGGGKKIDVTGSNFGSDSHLLINGTDISSSVNWVIRKDSRIKIKAAVPVLNLKAGQNSIQVMSGSLTSNVYILVL